MQVLVDLSQQAAQMNSASHLPKQEQMPTLLLLQCAEFYCYVQRRRKVYKIGGGSKSEDNKIHDIKESICSQYSFCLPGAGGVRTPPNPLQSICTVTIWHTANNQSGQPSLQIVKHANVGGGGGRCAFPRELWKLSMP